MIYREGEGNQAEKGEEGGNQGMHRIIYPFHDYEILPQDRFCPFLEIGNTLPINQNHAC